MPPLGRHYDMPVIVDESLARLPYIAFTLGTHRDVVRISFEDFFRLARPVAGEIAARSLVPA